MALAVSDIIIDLNTYIGDTSTDRVSTAERLSAITEAIWWLKEELDNDHGVNTYQLNYFDTINYYKLSGPLSDLVEGNDLRKAIGENDTPFTHSGSRDVVADIARHSDESSYAIERRDGGAYLVINHFSKYPGLQVSNMESLTQDGGTWQADTATSDATNLQVDLHDSTQGQGSFSFDITVAQSGNDWATIFNSNLRPEDLTTEKDLSFWILDVKLPSVTNITSYTIYWGSSTSDYYSVTATTDINGNAFVVGWNTLKFEWLGATVAGAPDDTAINYIAIQVNYNVAQTDETSFKLDNLRLIRPEILTFYYGSSYVGTDSLGTPLLAFGAVGDIPYFSGQYDGYKFAVAHKAASTIYRGLRLYGMSQEEENEALKSMNRVRKIIPKSRTPESRTFRPGGVSFMRGRRSRFRR